MSHKAALEQGLPERGGEQSSLLNKSTDAFYARIQQAQAESGWPVVIVGHEAWYLETANGRKLMGRVKRATVERLAKAGWLVAKMNQATGFNELYIR